MKYLTLSLFRIAAWSAVLSLTLVARAETGTQPEPQQIDNTSNRKDTLIAVNTVPDSLLRERLAKLQKDVPLTYHKAVQSYVDLFAFRKPGITKLMLERMPLFFPLYERMLAEYELPDELKYLSIVESSLTPRAVSHAGAGGLWQIMPGTGRDLKLHQDDYIDERMDPVKATEAACKYLRDLYAIFGDWELSMAAYNCGPGAVKRAMRRSGGDSFYKIYDALPKETRNYVPQFVAFTYLMQHAGDHGIFGDKFESPIPMDTIQITGYFNLESFARHSTMPLTDLQKMNPAITTTILPGHTNRYPLRVPRQQYAYFASHRQAILDSASRLPGRMEHSLLAHTEDVRYGVDSMGAWTALGTNPLAKISLEETPTEELVATSGKSVEKGAKLTAHLAEAESADESEEDVETVRTSKPRKQTFGVKKEVFAKAKRYTTRYHQVQNGDTLWNIVQRYDGLTIDRLKKMNRIRTNSLRPGQKLIVG